MSLTTQCPACRTTFKIVPDQLKISDGWVRCGHCSDVFDATRYLEGEVSDPVSVVPPPAAPVAPGTRAPVARPPAPSPGASRNDDEDEDGDWLLAPRPRNGPDSRQGDSGFQVSRAPVAPAVPAAPVAPSPRPIERPPEPSPALTPRQPQPPPPAPAPTPASLPRSAAPRARPPQPSSEPDSSFAPSSSFSHSVLTEEEFVDQLRSFVSASAKARAQDGGQESEAKEGVEGSERPRPASRSTPSVQTAYGGDEPDDPVDEDEPGFVRQARRRAFWRSGAMRVVLALSCLVLTLTLLGQWVVQERNVLAVRYPAAAPGIGLLCQAVGCEMGPVRQIESVVIDSSNLVRRLGNFYAFDLVLKNNASMPVAVPALELSLTDSRDNVISRRVFLAEELPGAPTMLPAQGSVSMSLRLTINDSGLSAMTGYRALVFYP